MVGHEKSDAHVPGIGRFLAGLFVLIAFSLAAMWAMFAFLARRDAAAPKPTLMEAQRVVPPSPRLEINNSLNLDALRAKEEKDLNTYGWVDKNAGIVRIPVDRAIDLIARRGLPATLQPAEKK